MITCATCEHFEPNPRNGTGMGRCLIDAWRGTRGPNWPNDTRSTPPWPNAPRHCDSHKELPRAAA